MRRRPIMEFRPDLERFEAKQLLSAGPAAAHAGAHVASLQGDPAALAPHPAEAMDAHGSAGGRQGSASHIQRMPPNVGYLAFRVTQKTYPLVPPFQHVLVQHLKPVPGQVYNVLYVALKNGTAQTFTAKDNFTVRIPGTSGTHRVDFKGFPILTGDQVWKPDQVIVFYIIGKKYYPLSPQVAAGFQFNLGGRSSTLVPGPSAIILRIKYNPATFGRTLDITVAYGQGAQGGLGPRFGIPDTAINEFTSAAARRIDYGGHF